MEIGRNGKVRSFSLKDTTPLALLFGVQLIISSKGTTNTVMFESFLICSIVCAPLLVFFINFTLISKKNLRTIYLECINTLFSFYFAYFYKSFKSFYILLSSAVVYKLEMDTVSKDSLRSFLVLKHLAVWCFLDVLSSTQSIYTTLLLLNGAWLIVLLIGDKNSDSKAMRKKLMKKAKQFAKTLNSIPDSLSVVSKEGKILCCNEELLGALGITNNEYNYEDKVLTELQNIQYIESKNLYYEYSNNLYEDVLHFIKESEEEFAMFGQSKIGEKTYEWKGKKIEWHNELAVLVVGTDIGQLLLLEKSLKENEYKSHILRTVSHELRSPTNGILGNCQLLKMTCENKLNDKCKKWLNSAIISCKHLLVLINDLVDYSQMVAGTLRLSFRPINFDEIANETLCMIDSVIHGKNIELKYVKKTSIPPVVKSEPDRLKQVLMNLLNNASKFTVSGFIHLVVKEEHGKLKISVKDSGIGIPEEKQTQLFTLFGRVDDYSELNPQGCGLGLYISNKLVQLLGGNGIGVKSVPGKGSCFTFSFPIKSSSDSPLLEEICEKYISDSNLSLPQITTKSFPDLRNFTVKKEVLVVDDSSFNRDVLVEQLNYLKIEADTASSGTESISKVSQKDYDLILMDCEMPDLSGWEATCQIRELFLTKRIPKMPDVIACTGFNASDCEQKCLDCGMKGIIVKPVAIEDLKEVLERSFNAQF